MNDYFNNPKLIKYGNLYNLVNNLKLKVVNKMSSLIDGLDTSFCEEDIDGAILNYEKILKILESFDYDGSNPEFYKGLGNLFKKIESRFVLVMKNVEDKSTKKDLRKLITKAELAKRSCLSKSYNLN